MTRRLIRCCCVAALLPAAALVAPGCTPGPPTDPLLLGPDSGQPAETLDFRTVSTSPQGRDVSYRFDWDDDSDSAWSPFAPSGDTFRRRHVFLEPGSYLVTALSRDRAGLESGASLPLPVRIAIAGPYPLGPPTGPDSVFPNEMTRFSARAGHVRGESVSVRFDWHGQLGDWTGWVPAGEPAGDSFRFDSTGNYAVRFHARDRAGNLSTWSPTATAEVRRRPLEPPTDLKLGTNNGTNVIARWNPGHNPPSTSYDLWFRPLGSTFGIVQTVTGGTAQHDPGGWTGCYTVSARRGDETRFAAETLSTIPVYSDTLLLTELNRPGPAGYGWSPAGRAELVEMTDTASAPRADLYFTDRSPGSNGPAFFLASPHLGPDDPGGTIPDEPWRHTGLGLLWNRPREPLPPYDTTFYTDLADVSLLESWLAVHTADGHFALVHSLDPNPAEARVRLRSWFQLIPGLRLVENSESTR